MEAAGRVEERLALHELIRIGVARQEDLRQLQSVVQSYASSDPDATKKVVKECQLREEWRSTRELSLLQGIQSTNFVSCTDVESRQLTEQLLAIQKLQEDQMRLQSKSRAAGPLRRSILRSTTSRPATSAGSGNSLGAALSLYSGNKIKRPSTSQQPMRQQSPGPLVPSKVRDPGLLAQSRLPRRSSSTNNSTNSSTNSRRNTVTGLYSSAPATPQHTPGPSRHHSVNIATAKSASLARSNSVSNVAVSSPNASSSTSIPRTSKGQGQGQAQGQAKGRFHQLFKLQGTLFNGISQHAASDGPAGAFNALANSVGQAQAFFLECFQEVMQSQRQGSPERGAQSRMARWDVLLQLGQLGLTSADVARLQQLRQAQAARVIQRHVRPFLKMLALSRAVEESHRRALEAEMLGRELAAVAIQRHVRGHLARQHTRAVQAARQAELQQRRMQQTRLNLAAIRIQRCYRQHLKQKKAQASRGSAAAAMVPSAAGSQHASSASGSGSGSGGNNVVCSTSYNITAAATATAAHTQVGQQQQQQQQLDTPKQQQRKLAAAVLIQACVRGWLVRRGQQLWWKQRLREMHRRRAAARTWQQHQQFMAATYGMQEQVLEAVVEEAELANRALSEVQAEREEFEAVWGEWVQQQFLTALQQPLPKGWVPHPHPDTGNICFLNTRTGELHAHHPSVLQLKGFVEAQRAHAEQKLHDREVLVASHIQQVHDASMRRQSQCLAQMGQVLQKQLVPGGSKP